MDRPTKNNHWNPIAKTRVSASGKMPRDFLHSIFDSIIFDPLSNILFRNWGNCREKNLDEHSPKNLEQKKLLMTIQWHSEEEFSHNKNVNLAILNDVTNPAHLICGVECSWLKFGTELALQPHIKNELFLTSIILMRTFKDSKIFQLKTILEK